MQRSCSVSSSSLSFLSRWCEDQPLVSTHKCSESRTNIISGFPACKEEEAWKPELKTEGVQIIHWQFCKGTKIHNLALCLKQHWAESAASDTKTGKLYISTFFFLPPCNNKLKLPTEKKALFLAQCIIVPSIPFVAFIGRTTHSISSHIEVYVLAHSWFSRLPLLTCWVNTSTMQLFQFVAVGFNCPLQLKKLVYVYLVRYAEEQQDLALLSISTFQRALKVTLLLYG